MNYVLEYSEYVISLESGKISMIGLIDSMNTSHLCGSTYTRVQRVFNRTGFSKVDPNFTVTIL